MEYQTFLEGSYFILQYIKDPLVGVCADFNFRPMQYSIIPFVFYVVPDKWSQRSSRVLYLRYSPEANVAEVAGYLRKCIAEADPHLTPGDIEIRTFEEELGFEYAKERRLATVVGLFTVLAVVIALMGVFGIVLFETQYRRREVAVRKVMGATTGEVLRLFLWMVVICFVIALPLSLWIVNRWMASFAYRAPFTVWIPVAALAAVLLVTAATVTFCSWRTANENPAESKSILNFFSHFPHLFLCGKLSASIIKILFPHTEFFDQLFFSAVHSAIQKHQLVS